MVFPNPFSDTTTFSCSKEGNYELKIFNIGGRLLDKSRFSGKELIYKNKNIESGIYYYEINDENGNYARGILIRN